MERYDLAVIGAGISGLGLAHFAAAAGLRVLVFEKEHRVGGDVRTHHVPASDFWLELGAHTLYNSYGNVIQLLEQHGLQNRIRERKKLAFKMLTPGGPRSITSQLQLPSLLLNGALGIWKNRSHKSVKGYFGGLVGEENYRRVVGPAFNAVICQPAADFPARFVFKRRSRRKDLPRSFTLEAGLSALPEAMARSDRFEVRLGEPVRSIEQTRDGWQINSVSAKVLALATPVDQASALLRPVDPWLATHLARIAVARLYSFSISALAPEVSVTPLAGLIPLASDGGFFSAVSRDVLPDSARRGFTFHFGEDSSGAKTAPWDQLRAIVLTRQAQEADQAQTLNQVPALRVGHEQWLSSIDEHLARRPGPPLLITGNYFGGLALEDCVSRSKAEVARVIKYQKT